jgi:hypothetical protein
MKIKLLFACLAVAALIVFVLPFTVGCTKQQAKTAEKLTVQLAEDLCTEVAAPQTSEPALVALLCKAGADKVTVLLPRTQWSAIKARKLDAGPGI